MYQLGDLCVGEGRRPLVCSVDEAPDESPSDVGDEEKGMRLPHSSGPETGWRRFFAL
jgi:hypothetical protein